MHDPDFISLFVAPREAAEIRYMITGSVAGSIYGEPRNTLDIDLFVLIQTEQIPLLPQLFPDENFDLPPADAIGIETRREARGHFNIIHRGTGLQADICLSRNHPCHPWALANTRRVQTRFCEITVAPPEYVILHKLESYRESGRPRHVRDVAGMIEQQDLDRQFLDSSIQNLHLEPQRQSALALTSS